MEKFLYFAKGSGANLTEEAYVVEAKNLACVVPRSETVTVAYFIKTDEDKDRITFTHDDTTETTGHRCREIAKAMAEAANSTSNLAMIDVIDFDNKKFMNNLSFVTSMLIDISV